jgi:hypothetical protein
MYGNGKSEMKIPIFMTPPNAAMHLTLICSVDLFPLYLNVRFTINFHFVCIKFKFAIHHYFNCWWINNVTLINTFLIMIKIDKFYAGCNRWENASNPRLENSRSCKPTILSTRLRFKQVRRLFKSEIWIDYAQSSLTIIVKG